MIYRYLIEARRKRWTFLIEASNEASALLTLTEKVGARFNTTQYEIVKRG